MSSQRVFNLPISCFGCGVLISTKKNIKLLRANDIESVFKDSSLQVCCKARFSAFYK